MTDIIKRSLALLLALVLCLSLMPAALVHVEAATVNYVYDSTGKYIYNWGTRGTTATFLSPKAEAFYSGKNTYDTLSALAGGTGTSDAPKSALFAALQKLMKDAHTHQTSYQETRNLYQYTDCQNNGGKISSFYSGKAIGPTWDGSFNREHTWPNSKGLGGNDENDIIMLRPTSTQENSARGNAAYGQSSGYYNPNSESSTLDLRGDVARIFLYVYVRWGNVNGNGSYTTWGSRGVMESLDVLLLWMEQDPVDTWELGRNDAVQAITGTRNVFVDYPEFAFLLFGAEMPTQMSTPSGEASGAVSCQHKYVASTTVAATCTTDGYTVYKCSLCSKSYQGDKVPAGHKYVNGVCAACGAAQFGVIDKPVVDTPYKFGMVQPNVSASDVYYINGGMNNTYYLDTSLDKNAALDVYLEKATGGYYLYTYINGAKKYINMVVSGTHVNGVYQATASTVYTYDATSKTLIATVNGAPYWFGTRNDKNYTTVGPCATSYNGYYCQFYGGISKPSENPVCKHTNTTVKDYASATCTEKGHTGKTVCVSCGVTIDAGKAIDALGHNLTQYEGKTPNCVENGWKAYEKCDRCDYSTYEELVSNGHGYDTVVTAPTCANRGYTTYTCAGCGDRYVGDEVAALDHAMIHVGAKEATTEEAGNIEYWYCQTCQNVWTDEACTVIATWEGVVLPMLDAPDTTDTQNATDATDASKDSENGLPVLVIVLIPVLIVGAIVAVVIVLLKKKK